VHRAFVCPKELCHIPTSATYSVTCYSATCYSCHTLLCHMPQCHMVQCHTIQGTHATVPHLQQCPTVFPLGARACLPVQLGSLAHHLTLDQ